jgi:hypothetical protein
MNRRFAPLAVASITLVVSSGLGARGQEKPRPLAIEDAALPRIGNVLRDD